MTSPVISVTPDMDLKQAAQVLVQNRIAAVPVLEEGRLVGMLSELDTLWAQTLSDPRVHARVVPQAPVTARTVADVMSRDVIALSVDADTAELVNHMRRANVRSIPIVHADRVVGIVARRDLLRSITRDDADILSELQVRLREALPDGQAWGVAVDGGVARLWPLRDERPDRETALLVAAEVPGLLHAVFTAAPASD